MSSQTNNEQPEITIIDSRTGKTSTKKLPTDEVLEKRGKEMKVVLDLIRYGGYDFVKGNLTILGSPYDVQDDETFKNWFINEMTKQEFFTWLFTNVHQVGGGEGEWRNGQFGSRWCDKKFCGRWCRIAFYGKEELDKNDKKYKLMICDL